MLESQLNLNIVKNKGKLLGFAKYLFFVSLYSIPLYLYHIGVYRLEFLTNIVFDIVKNLLKGLDAVIIDYKTKSIYYSGYIFSIDYTCSGFKSFYSIFPLILATPKIDFKTKIIYSVIFGSVMWILNILRIISVIVFSPSIDPKFLHNLLWPIFNVLFTIVLYLVFLKNNGITKSGLYQRVLKLGQT